MQALIAIQEISWEVNPYQLVSWWDMERFAARAFYQIGRLLEQVKTAHTLNISKTLRMEGVKLYTSAPDAKIAEGDKKALDYFYDAIRGFSEHIGLRLSVVQIDRLREDLGKELTNQDIVNGINELDSRIRDEMEGHLFMFIPPDRAKSYDNIEPFGKGVSAKFPLIQFDLTEAGNCYATGRGTACVFHLMRVMETGVQEFGNKLGVALASEKNWQNILDEINKQIKALPAKDPATVEMSEASANLYAVKLAWRNNVMHPKDTYTMEEAENIMRQVKLFMVQLAKIV